MQLAGLFLLGCAEFCLRAFEFGVYIFFLKETLNYYVKVHLIVEEIFWVFYSFFFIG